MNTRRTISNLLRQTSNFTKQRQFPNNNNATRRLSSTTPSSSSSSSSSVGPDLQYFTTLVEESSATELQSLTSKLSQATINDLKAIRGKYGKKIIEAAEPERWQLYRHAVTLGIPFIGFGIMDNAIMIIAGDQVRGELV